MDIYSSIGSCRTKSNHPCSDSVYNHSLGYHDHHDWSLLHWNIVFDIPDVQMVYSQTEGADITLAYPGGA